MPETPAFLTERLKVEGEKAVAIFAALHPDQWNQVIYTEGAEWTVRNLLAHFVTAEKGFLKLFASIRAGGAGASEDFDIDRYNASQQAKTRDLAPRELLEQYQTTRAAMIALVASFTVADLEKQGRHPFLGLTTLAEMVKLVYRHNQLHFRDMHKLIRG
jgi:hypothetical protein